MNGRLAVAASAEVNEHHAAVHERRCGADLEMVERRCPCDTVKVWQCKRCGERLFWAYRAWCEHARDLWASVQ